MFRLNQVVLFLLVVAAAWAQEYRATFVGVVTDPSGAGVVGAKVTITNLGTSIASVAKTEQSGEYAVPLLLPGNYTLRVEHTGFRPFERSPIELRVNDRMRVDAALQVGDVSSAISVTAESPLLEEATASRGQVIANRYVTDMPLNGRNPYSLVGLAAGVQYTGSLVFSRPFDNGAIADFSINGGRSRVNEYQIDGSPNNANDPGADIAYVPPVEATQEMKIQTSTYDAQYGRTSGGIVTLSTRSGSNVYHGAVYDYLMRAGWSANQFSNNANRQPRPQNRVDQYGFRVDGPVMLPKIYRGRDRTFFMFNWEHYRQDQPTVNLATVPTDLERNGDFSKTLRSNGVPFTIYDPQTTRLNPAYDPSRPVTITNPQYIRSPFPSNVIPKGRFDRVGGLIALDYTAPNLPGDPVTGTNNLFAQAPGITPYTSMVARIDHSLNDNWRLFGRWHYTDRDSIRGNVYNNVGRAAIDGKAIRQNDGGAVNLSGTLTPRTVLDLRAGITRFGYFFSHKPFDMSQLGFPSSFIAQLQTPDKYPQISAAGYTPLSTNDVDRQFSTQTSFSANLLRMAGKHSWKAGFEFRLIQLATVGRNNGFGNFTFDAAMTGLTPQLADPAGGNAIASLLLGLPASGVVNTNAQTFTSWHYPVLYFQDDWQVSRRITLNFGLRWDYESPAYERYNRQNRGFDPVTQSPIKVTGMDLRGGLLFAGQGQPAGAFDPSYANFQPRAGLAWKLTERHPLVFRAGVGRYYLPTSDTGGTQGFSEVSTMVTLTPAFLPLRTLADPFPDGLNLPAGPSLGLRTGAGTALSYSDPGRVVPSVWQYTAGLQYEFWPGLLVDASYSGSRTRDLQVTRSASVLSRDQIALGTQALNRVVSNPFFGVLPSNTPLGAQATTQFRNLIVPYPQFSSVTSRMNSLGSSWYHAFQMKVEQRMKHGLTVLVAFTGSKTMESTTFLNPQDTVLARNLTSFDVPRRLSVSGVYELPFGRGKKLLSTGVPAHVVGGWQLSWTQIVQSGTPLALPGGWDLRGDPRLTSGQTLSRWFDTSSSIWVQRAADTYRTIPLYSPNIRLDTAPQTNLTLTREFRFLEVHQVQFRASAFNALNTPIFGAPNTTPTSPLFGVVPITQTNAPRSVELGLRYRF
jgi:opacity protein-like surface antigen